jgi:hypothetical protein
MYPILKRDLIDLYLDKSKTRILGRREYYRVACNHPVRQEPGELDAAMLVLDDKNILLLTSPCDNFEHISTQILNA